jgi:hypothetical protein
MNPVIFVHIPKACGTTLIKLLYRWCSREEIYEVGTKPRETQMTDLRGQPGVRLILGHATFGLHETLAEPARYITILREPIERVISHFHYASRTPEHHLHQQIRAGEIDLFQLAKLTANLQTRYLGGLVEDVPDERTLDRAKENVMQHFAMAGVAERFDEAIVLLHRIFEKRLLPFANENVASRRSSADTLSSDDLRVLRSHHELDYALYDFVRARFEEQLAQQDGSFAKQVAALHLGNRIANLANRIRRCLRPGDAR